MVKVNPRLRQISSKVFLSKNMKVEHTKYSLAFIPRNSYVIITQNVILQEIHSKVKDKKRNKILTIALIGVSGTGPWLVNILSQSARVHSRVCLIQTIIC